MCILCHTKYIYNEKSLVIKDCVDVVELLEIKNKIYIIYRGGIKKKINFTNKILSLHAENCVNLLHINLPSLIYLSMTNCIIREIKNLPNLKDFYCNNCPIINLCNLKNIKLISLSYCNELISLDIKKCGDCCKIDLWKCARLENIKNINADYITDTNYINILKIHACKQLRHIEPMENLRELYIFHCPAIYNLNGFKQLKFCIVLNNLSNLMSITDCNMQNIVHPSIINCGMLIMGATRNVDYVGCKWIYNTDDINCIKNAEYNLRLKSVIKCQKIIRNKLIKIGWKKYLKSKQFIEWIYNPNNIGGFYEKKKFTKFANELQ